MLLVVLLSILRTIVEYNKDDREKQITKTIHTIIQNPQGQKRNKAKHEGYYDLHWPKSFLLWYSTLLSKGSIFESNVQSLI